MLRHRLASLLAQSRSATSLELIQGTESCSASCRGFAKVPEEYQKYYSSPAAQRSGIAKHVQTEGAAAAGSEASQSAATPGPTTPTRVWMLPWERRQIEGTGPLRSWEKVYWGIFVSALAIFLFSRTHSSAPAKEDPEVAKQREDRKKHAARAVLAGQSVTDGEVFEGLSPQEIQEYVAKVTNGATAADPYEGLSPEEINDYLAGQKG